MNNLQINLIVLFYYLVIFIKYLAIIKNIKFENIIFLKILRVSQLEKLLFIPLVIGFVLLALKTILNNPIDKVYLLSGLAFRYLNKKKPKGAFRPIITTVKNTMNLR